MRYFTVTGVAAPGCEDQGARRVRRRPLTGEVKSITVRSRASEVLSDVRNALIYERSSLMPVPSAEQ